MIPEKEKRPDSSELLEKLKELEKHYKQHTDEWNKTLQPKNGT